MLWFGERAWLGWDDEVKGLGVFRGVCALWNEASVPFGGRSWVWGIGLLWLMFLWGGALVGGGICAGGDTNESIGEGAV